MTTLTTETIQITIDASFERVAADLADVTSHPQWATEFFASPAAPTGDGTYRTIIPRLGGAASVRIDAHVDRGVIDMYLAPDGAPFGPPLPIRVLPNGDGVDVLFTLARFPGVGEDEWQDGLESMRRELSALKARHENAR